MNFLVALAALFLLMFVAYRGFSVILFAPIAAMLAVFVTDPVGRADHLHVPLHGEDGRLRETLFPGLPARRHLRQGHRTVGIRARDRDGGDRLRRQAARDPVDRARLRDPDLWRRFALRRRLRGLSLRGRNVPAKRHPEAADSRNHRARRFQLHDGFASGHAADPKHHPDDLLPYDDLGRAHSRHHWRRLHSVLRPRLSGMAPAPGGAGGRGLRIEPHQRAGAGD